MHFVANKTGHKIRGPHIRYGHGRMTSVEQSIKGITKSFMTADKKKPHKQTNVYPKRL